MNTTKFEDKVKAVLYATAYGDAIGAVVEKLSYEEIKEKYGRVDSLNYDWYKSTWSGINKKRGHGIVTDDTLMTIALMNIYNDQKRHLDAWDMADGMVKEIAFKKTYIPEFGREDCIIERLFYPEKWIFMRHTLANCEPREGGIGNMINCGAAMYIAPVGIANACNPQAAYNEAINFASGHQSSYGLEAAGVLAACVAKAFEPGVTINDVVETAVAVAKDGTGMAIKDICEIAKSYRNNKSDKDLIVDKFHSVLSKYSPMGDNVNRKIEKVGLPSNHYTPSRIFSIEELPLALGYSVLNDGDFKNSIIDGINSGRDTDSIGVMIGVILGAMHGKSVLNEEEINILEQVNKINFNDIADKFANTAHKIIMEDHEQYEKSMKDIKKIL
ncbi:MAG: ADP-ribosylglycohydrolase family protein [bacterium]|nr:ADP-ribosylglycohydrolase family protein [bacterium]